jgi:ribosomal protein S1
VSVGDKVKVKVIKVNPEERKIGLTLLEVTEPAPDRQKSGTAESSAAPGGDGGEARESETPGEEPGA